MEREISSCSVNVPAQASNYDELLMQHHLLFAESLKDLKNIRRQLYSAAEYFESSYNRDDNKQLVVETLKDYVTNALVSSVDHLGSVAYKVNSFLDDKVNEISETSLRFSCIEQRLRVCQEFIEQGGIRQQSLVIETPKYHKRYIIPVEPTLDANSKTKWNRSNPSLFLEDDFHQSTHATMVKSDMTLFRKKRISRPPSASSSSGPGNFLFTRAASNKLNEEFHRFAFHSNVLNLLLIDPFLQIILIIDSGFHQCLRDRLPCQFILKPRRHQKSWNNIPTEVKDSA